MFVCVFFIDRTTCKRDTAGHLVTPHKHNAFEPSSDSFASRGGPGRRPGTHPRRRASLLNHQYPASRTSAPSAGTNKTSAFFAHAYVVTPVAMTLALSRRICSSLLNVNESSLVSEPKASFVVPVATFVA